MNCPNPDCKEKNNPAFLQCWKCDALLNEPFDSEKYKTYKKLQPSLLRTRPAGLVLGLFDILLGMLHLFLILITQFGLILFAPLGIIYFIGGESILSLNPWFKKIFQYGVVPASLLAAWNVWLFGRTADVPAYFKIPSKAQMVIIGFFVLIPFICNFVYLTLPRVKKDFLSLRL